MKHDYQREERSSQRDTDLELAQGVARHDPNAVAQFFELHNESVVRYVRHVVSGIQEVELQDTVQETFIAALQAIRDYRGDSSLSTWVLRIAYYKAVDLLRRIKKLDRNEATFSAVSAIELDGDRGPFVDPIANVEEAVVTAEQVRLVREALAELPDEQREAMTLRYINGLKVDDVATAMNVNKRMVELHITRARQTLRQKLASWQTRD
jgi:RNA polymerase sigma-70 factor (ECF subfamily)